jgi:cytoskeletal protein CcmA (bactofilin family)
VFTRKSDKVDGDVVLGEVSRVEARPLIPMQGNAPERVASHIGCDLTIIGSIESEGEVIFDGRIEGDIVSGKLVVGHGAVVIGKIKSGIVSVKGSVSGTVWANRLSLLAGSKVEGDIYHSQLSIEEGAYFEGRSRRSDGISDASVIDVPHQQKAVKER